MRPFENNPPLKPQHTTNSANIPEELKKLSQWVGFNFEWDAKRKKWKKVPYQTNGRRASTTNPTHWSSYKEIEFYACSLEAADGIGFVFTSKDPYCGIDLDHCVDPTTKEISSWALKWIELFSFSGAYMEYSPSGTGIKIFTKAKLPFHGRKNGDIEIYDQARYFTVTGNVYGLCQKEIPNQQAAVDQLLDEVFSNQPKTTTNKIAPLSGNELTSEELNLLIQKAKKAENGEKFLKLFNGDYEDYHKSQSEADASLCTMFAFYTDCNEMAIDQLFRESHLYREKWERPDYRTGTIRNAIDFYKKSRNKLFADSIVSPDKSHLENVEPLPLIHIVDVEEKDLEFLVEGLWVLDSVGFISAQPKSGKTWLSLEIGISVASGTNAFGHFPSKRGKVIAFNAEDDPARGTRQRIAGLCASKKLALKDIDFHLINVPSLLIDDTETQKRIEKTVSDQKPALIILDPLFNLHSKDEDKSKELSEILHFLRLLNRTYKCSILLVCHDKKPSGNKNQSTRRESQTRGSNSLEGWADNLIFVDDEDKTNAISRVYIRHRNAPLTEPFYFQLLTETQDKKIKVAALHKMDSQGLLFQKDLKLQQIITTAMSGKGAMRRDDLRSQLKIRKNDFDVAFNAMICSGEIIELVDEKDKRKKRYQYRSSTGT